MDDEKAVDMLLKCKERKLDIEDGRDGRSFRISVDGFPVLKAISKGSSFFMSMLPDIFTFSDWSGLIETRTIHFNVQTEDRMSVSFNTTPATKAEIISVVYDALVDINLYGYVNED